MYIPDELAWAFEDKAVSTVKIFCEESKRNEIASFFENLMEEEWKAAVEKVENEYRDEDEKDEYDDSVPVNVSVADYGVCIKISKLLIYHSWGNYCDLYYAVDAFDFALKGTKKRYPEIEYDGYIIFPWSDASCGTVYQWAVSSKKCDESTVYDFIGKAFNDIFEFEEHIWEREYDRDTKGLVFVVTGKLKHFNNREEITDYIEKLGATASGSISKNTDYLINNDITSNSSKNKKAKELNIPVITEDEFIARFGNPKKYGIDTDNSLPWCNLANFRFNASVACFKETFDVLYAHKEWIKEDVLRKTIFSFIDIATETHPDYREELLDYFKKLESGGTIEKGEEDKTDECPNDYMMVLEAFTAADEYEKELAHDGVLPKTPSNAGNQRSSYWDPNYPRVSLKASEGDARAIEILEMLQKCR